MLAGYLNLEVLRLEFPEKAWFFSNLLLDEILVVNPYQDWKFRDKNRRYDSYFCIVIVESKA